MADPTRTPLSGTEAAFVRLVLEEHQALIRNADQTRDRRMAVLLAEKEIPASASVAFEAKDLDGPVLVWTEA